MSKKSISVAQLNKHLTEQIAALKASAESYDAGSHFEAKRLATSIRILVHDTKASHSLLAQLGMKNRIRFLDTVGFDDVVGNPMSYHPLVSATTSKERFIAMLDDTPGTPVPFDAWWNRMIFRDQAGHTLTRKQLVLTAANKDGGAHVDGKIDAAYADLAQNLKWLTSSEPGVWETIVQPELAGLRQIGHEVIKTLDPSYGKAQKPVGFAIAGMVPIFAPKP